METLKKILKEKYQITAKKISAVQGGWASLAYKIEDTNGDFFFLKVYEKNRKSTPFLTQHIDIYLPIIDFLNNTSLKGKIIQLIKTQTQDYKFEDENNVYLLFEYIDGHTVGEQNLTEEQVYSLADIVSQLHSLEIDIPIEREKISETFYQSFIPELREWIGENFNLLKEDIKELLKPNLSKIEEQINELSQLSDKLKEQDLKFCLCHTDIHHWNIMVNDNGLYLLDWEGVKFASPEADIFSLYEQPYFNSFIKRYRENNTSYQINDIALQYYSISRKLLDIFEFIEQLQFDELNLEEYKINLNHLQKEVNSII